METACAPWIDHWNGEETPGATLEERIVKLVLALWTDPHL